MEPTELQNIAWHGKTTEQRFNEKTAISDSKFYESTPCIEWTGHRNKGGYGSFGMAGTKTPIAAHRWAYLRFVGPIPRGYHVDHLCRNTACVSPAHLEAVTPQENIGRIPMVIEGRERAAFVAALPDPTTVPLPTVQPLAVQILREHIQTVIVNRVKPQRERRGWNVRTVGRLLGYTGAQVSNWELGHNLPPLAAVILLFEVLGLDVDELLAPVSELVRLPSENHSGDLNRNAI